MTDTIPVIGADEAQVQITYGGNTGELPDPVRRDLDDATIIAGAQETIRGGGIPGLPADPEADLTDFVVHKNPPHEARPYHLYQVRPKTPFGLTPKTPFGIFGAWPSKT